MNDYRLILQRHDEEIIIHLFMSRDLRQMKYPLKDTFCYI